MATVSTIITVVALFFMFIGAVKGFKQGISREIIRAVTIAASVVASIFIAKAFYGKIISFFDGKSIEDIHAWITGLKFFPNGLDISWILNIDAETAKSVLIIPMVLIIIPLIFVGFFIPLCALTKILHVVLCGIFGLSKNRKNFITSILGMAVGAVESALIIGLVCLPLIGIGNAAKTAVEKVNKEMPESESTVQLTNIYGSYLKPITENTAVSLISKCGINAIYTNLVTVNENNEKVPMTNLLPDIAMMYANKSGFNGFHWQTLTPENITAINNITDILESNPYLSDVAANAIRSIAVSYKEGKINLPVSAPYDTVVNEMIHILETVNSENLHGDIDTIIEVYCILSDSRALVSFNEDSDSMLKSLTEKDANGTTPVNKILDEIKKNERTKPLITIITKLSVSIMSENLGLSEETMQVYEDVKTGLNETIKINRKDYAEGDDGEKEYRSAVSKSLDTTLKDNGITLEPEIVDTMADYVADNFADKEEITDDELNDIILSYYDAYVDYINNGTTPDELPEGVTP